MSTDAATVESWLDRMADDVRAQLGDATDNLLVVGIYTGGVRVAGALHQRLEPSAPLGTLDISFHRDDYTRAGLQPQVHRSELPFSLDDHTVLLVDDVLYSGRTVRAALNVLFDYGRPQRVMLGVLVERSGHELPIRADIAGCRVDLASGRRVRLNQADLGFETHDVPVDADHHG